MSEIHCVTGAFGYSGSYIARELLALGHRVRTLTTSTGREHGFGDRVEVYPLDFADTAGLCVALTGVRVLYNTYWVRFSRAGFSQTQAVRNTKALFAAAKAAGVERVVHVSITNPSLTSPYEYFRGKAELEAALGDSGLPHTILRPAVLFGGPDILINNMAWLLRRFPVFGIFGNGDYRMRPIHVRDLAELAVRSGEASGNEVIDAVGPETLRYRDLVRELGAAIGKQRPLLRVHAGVGWGLAQVLGWLLGDVLLTRAEIDALMDDLLVTAAPPTGATRLSDWMRSHRETLGVRYGNELARRRDRLRAYTDL